jgi:putative aldouronate transport system permease protein
MVLGKSIGSRTFDAFLLIMLIVIAVCCVAPLWYMLAVSLSSKSAAAAGEITFWPVGFTMVSYRQLIGDAAFFRSFGISLERATLGAAVNFIVIVLMAYPLSKSNKDFRLRNMLMWILVFAMLFNGGLIPWYLTIRNLHLIDNIWGLVLGGGVPVFNVILVINYFRNLPKELEEAALVDGAGPWRILFGLFVPLAVPVLATVTLFGIVYHWNEFFNGMILSTKQAHYPLQTYIQQLVVTINTQRMTEDDFKKLNEMSNQTLNAAKIFIAMIPVLIIYPLLQRFFIHGITLGSVKE